MDKTSNRHLVFLICAVLAAAVFIVYGQVRHNGFVNYDDQTYITENSHINGGITIPSVIWAFTAFHFYMWHPLTSLSHMLDCQLFGLDPSWHHIVNLLFHTVNTLLLFWVLQRMTGAVWPSAFVAAVFGLHPLNVESVAWLAERKNVLCGFFWMLTIAAYVRYAERPGIGRYLLVVLAFCLGLMSKPMIVTLPFVLLLLDYWPLGQKGRSAWRLIGEKVPLFILSAIVSVITFFAQQNTAAVVRVGDLPVGFRIANTVVSYVIYIRKMIWPTGLAVFYPHPGNRLSMWQVLLSAVLLIVVSALVIWLAGFGKLTTSRRHKYLLVGWLWYLGTLVPVIGLVQVGEQALADRYAYISLIGLFIIIAWGLPELLERQRYRKIVLVASATVALLILSVCTYVQVRYWQDSITLFEHTLAVTKDNYGAHFGISKPLLEQGRVDEAIYHSREAIRILPDYADAHVSLGSALIGKGQFDEAVVHFTRALQIEPNCPQAHAGLGYVLGHRGMLDDSVKEYQLALQLLPDNPSFHNDFGVVLGQKGEFDHAVEHFTRALQIKPDFAEARRNLDIMLSYKREADR